MEWSTILRVEHWVPSAIKIKAKINQILMLFLELFSFSSFLYFFLSSFNGRVTFKYVPSTPLVLVEDPKGIFPDRRLLSKKGMFS